MRFRQSVLTLLAALLVAAAALAQEPRTDRLGDALPDGAIQRLGTLRMRMSLADFCYLPDGNAAIVSGQHVTVWNLAAGIELETHRVSDASLVSVVARSDGSALLLGDSNGQIIDWDLQRQEPRHSFPAELPSLTTVCYSPDETRVLVAGRAPPAVKEFDLATGRELVSIKVERMPTLNLAIYGPDGRTALVGGGYDEDVLAEYDLQTGEKVKNILDRLEGLPNWYYIVRSLALSPDGKRLAVGGRYKGCEVDLDTYEVLQTYAGLAGGQVLSIAYLPDGEHILMGSRDGSIWLRDRHTGDIVLRWFPHEAYVGRLAVSPDGQYVLSYGAGLLTESDLLTGQSRLDWPRHIAGVNAAAFVPGSTEVVSASADATVRVWDAESGDSRLTIRVGQMGATSVAVSPGGSRMAVGYLDDLVREFDLADGSLIRSVEEHRGHVKSVTYSPDDAWLLSSADDGSIRMRHGVPPPGYAPSRVMHGYHRGGILCLAVSPDSQRLLTAGRDATVRLWDLAGRTVERTMEGHWGWVTAVAFAGGNDRAVSGSADGRLLHWDVASGEVLGEMEHGGQVEAVVCSSDGARVYSAGSDRRIICWDLATGEQIAVLTGHTGTITSLALSQDDRLLVSASRDTTLLVWETPPE